MAQQWKKIAILQAAAAKIRRQELEIRFLNAVLKCDPVIIQECLQNGASPNFHSGNHFTALHMAAENGNTRLISILLQYRDTNIDKQTNFGTTPLLLACKTNRINAVELLLKRGANIEIADKNGYRPLHIACLLNHERIVTLLLKYRAKINVFNVFGKTPLHLSTADNPNKFIAKSLIRRGAVIYFHSPVTMPVLLECALVCDSERHLEIIELLLDKGADINTQDQHFYRTALHMSAMSGYEPLVIYLLDRGADKTLTDYRNETPLQLAQRYGNNHIIDLLIPNESIHTWCE